MWVRMYQLRRLRQIRRHVSSVRKSQHSWYLRSYFPGWTTVTLFWPACHDIPLNHSSVFWTQQPGSFSTFACTTTPALQQLHWLPIEYRITYKLCLTMHLVHTNRTPQYFTLKCGWHYHNDSTWQLSKNLDFVRICLRRLFDCGCSYVFCCVIAILPCCFDVQLFATMIYMVNKVEYIKTTATFCNGLSTAA